MIYIFLCLFACSYVHAMNSSFSELMPLNNDTNQMLAKIKTAIQQQDYERLEEKLNNYKNSLKTINQIEKSDLKTFSYSFVENYRNNKTRTQLKGSVQLLSGLALLGYAATHVYFKLNDNDNTLSDTCLEQIHTAGWLIANEISTILTPMFLYGVSGMVFVHDGGDNLCAQKYYTAVKIHTLLRETLENVKQ